MLKELSFTGSYGPQYSALYGLSETLVVIFTGYFRTLELSIIGFKYYIFSTCGVWILFIFQ